MQRRLAQRRPDWVAVSAGRREKRRQVCGGADILASWGAASSAPTSDGACGAARFLEYFFWAEEGAYGA
jgi:hypothetical protein